MASKTADVDSPKRSLRSEMRELRASLPAGERSSADAAIRSLVLGLTCYRDAQTVLTYLSFGSEVDTWGIIEAAWRDGKTVALPRCMGPLQMRWFSVTDLDGLERSAFGVDEPRICAASEVFPESCGSAVALVPGLSFDGEGYRLGYGGGYYDAFLSAFEGVSVGLCRKAQMSDSPLPRGAFDLPVDIVATDAGICTCKAPCAEKRSPGMLE